MVRDEVFGDGIATGAVPISGDTAVNVTVRWLGLGSHLKPPSRGGEFLTVVGEREGDPVVHVVTRHTGAQFESGYGSSARFNSWVILKKIGE